MWAILAFGSFLGAVVVHLLTARAALPFSNVVRYILFGGSIGAILSSYLVVLYGFSSEALAGVLIFAFLSELYMFVFTLVIGSVSVSLLVYLRTGEVDEAELSKIFSPSRMVAFRLDQLVANGFAEVQNGRYALTSNGRRLVRWFTLLRRIMGHNARTQQSG